MTGFAPTQRQLEDAVRHCVVTDERTYLHLALPMSALVGVNVRRVGALWEYRGTRMRISGDPAGAATLLAVLTHRDGDVYLDLHDHAARWVKPHRSGVAVHHFGEEFVLGVTQSLPRLVETSDADGAVRNAGAAGVLEQLTGHTGEEGTNGVVLRTGGGTLTVPYQHHRSALSIGVDTHDVLPTYDRRPTIEGWSIIGVSRRLGVPVALHLASGVTAIVETIRPPWTSGERRR